MTKSEMFTAVSKVAENSLGFMMFDKDYKGGQWEISAVETQETLADFDNSKNNWAECSGRIEGTAAGFKFLGWVNVQVKKGQARQSITVIDFDDFRIVLDLDPKNLND